IRVHGNVATPDDEIVRLAGVAIGSSVAPETPAEIEARLKAAKRFQRVDVLKRFASIDDPSRIVLVIVVDEGPVKIERTGDPDDPTRVVRTHGGVLFLPLLSAEDGYGVTYGANFAVPNRLGKQSRVSFP